MAGRAWERSEDQRLRAMAPNASSKEIAAALGRTRDAVMHRARVLRISLLKTGDAAPNTKYSDALIEKARQLHDQGYGPRWIAKRLEINECTLRAALYYRQRVAA